MEIKAQVLKIADNQKHIINDIANIVADMKKNSGGDTADVSGVVSKLEQISNDQIDLENQIVKVSDEVKSVTKEVASINKEIQELKKKKTK